MSLEDDSPELSADLHQRLLSEDLTASSEIAERFLPGLVAYMRSRHASVHDEHLIETAATDALLNYLRRPEQYDPTKMDLERYLRMAARYDLKNELAKIDRELELLGKDQVVELDASDVEHLVEGESAVPFEEQIETLASPVWGRLLELIPDEVDLEIVLLMMEGVRDSNEYAVVLGIMHLSPDERAKEVKRHKDRLKKWLQRHIVRSELMDNE